MDNKANTPHRGAETLAITMFAFSILCPQTQIMIIILMLLLQLIFSACLANWLVCWLVCWL